MTLIDERPSEAPVDITRARDGSPIFGGDPGQIGVVRVMSGRGDTPIAWRVGNRTEEDIARAAFNKAKDRGWLAYRVDPDDKTKGTQMREFDPKAGEVILSPAPVGG